MVFGVLGLISWLAAIVVAGMGLFRKGQRKKWLLSSGGLLALGLVLFAFLPPSDEQLAEKLAVEQALAKAAVERAEAEERAAKAAAEKVEAEERAVAAAKERAEAERKAAAEAEARARREAEEELAARRASLPAIEGPSAPDALCTVFANAREILEAEGLDAAKKYLADKFASAVYDLHFDYEGGGSDGFGGGPWEATVNKVAVEDNRALDIVMDLDCGIRLSSPSVVQIMRPGEASYDYARALKPGDRVQVTGHFINPIVLDGREGPWFPVDHHNEVDRDIVEAPNLQFRFVDIQPVGDAVPPDLVARLEGQVDADLKALEAAAKVAEKERKAREATECRQDESCWGDKHLIDATIQCEPEVERLANYDFEWTDGLLTPKFSRVGWLDREAGTLQYAGDRIKFQNGFGAWQNAIYICRYDPKTKSVLEVLVEPGRL